MKSKSINIKWLEFCGSIEKIPKKNNYEICHHKNINLNDYKKIYNDVGKKYNWLGRLNIKDNELISSDNKWDRIQRIVIYVASLFILLQIIKPLEFKIMQVDFLKIL